MAKVEYKNLCLISANLKSIETVMHFWGQHCVAFDVVHYFCQLIFKFNANRFPCCCEVEHDHWMAWHYRVTWISSDFHDRLDSLLSDQSHISIIRHSQTNHTSHISIIRHCPTNQTLASLDTVRPSQCHQVHACHGQRHLYQQNMRLLTRCGWAQGMGWRKTGSFEFVVNKWCQYICGHLPEIRQRFCTFIYLHTFISSSPLNVLAVLALHPSLLLLGQLHYHL